MTIEHTTATTTTSGNEQEEEDDAAMVMSKLWDAAKDQNALTKKKSNVISDVVSLFEHIKSKFTKEKKIRVKTKEKTRVIVLSNKTI